MDISATTIILGLIAVFFTGLSKTAFPGISILGIVILANAFPGNEKQTAGVLLPLLVIGDVMAVSFYRKHTDWKTLRRIFPHVLIGIAIGAVLLRLIPDAQFGVVLGFLLLGLLSLDYARKRFGADWIPHAWWFAVVLGILAGVSTTLANAAGPVMAVYLIALGMSKERFMGCAAMLFFIVNLLKIPIFANEAMITRETLTLDLYILPGMLAGAIAGRLLLKRVPQAAFDRLILILAALGSLKMALGDWIAGLFS